MSTERTCEGRENSVTDVFDCENVSMKNVYHADRMKNVFLLKTPELKTAVWHYRVCSHQGVKVKS